MKTVHPYLNFPGNTLEAFEFYRSVFGGEFTNVTRFRDMAGGMGVAEAERDRIANIGLMIAPGVCMMATDVVESFPRSVVVGNNVHIMLEADSKEEAERVFAALSDGGRVDMPLQATAWAELYGSCSDRFGVLWMVNYAGDVRFG